MLGPTRAPCYGFSLVRLLLLVILLSTTAPAEPRGKLLSVRSAGDAATAAVELRGDRPLSFTTLKLLSPPRVVVDCADTAVGEVPRQVEVDDGTVRRIGVTSAGARTARVVIELVADAEFDVRASGSRIEVRVPRAAPLLAGAPARDREAGAGELAASATASANPAARGEAAAPERPAELAVVEAPSLVVAAPAPPVRAAPPAPQRAVEAPAPPAAVAKNEEPPARGAGSDGAARGVRRTEAVPRSPAVAQREAAPSPATRPEEAATGARQEAATATRREEAAAAASAEGAWQARSADAQKRASLPTVALLGSRPVAREEVEPDPPPPPFGPATQAKQRTIATAIPGHRAPPSAPARRAPAPNPLPTSAPAKAGSASAAGQSGSAADPRRQRRVAAAGPARKLITGIGFRPAQGGVVIVRSNKPLEYGVSGEDGAVLIHLPRTAIPLPNNRRPLDTRFFDGPVRRIVPLAVAGGTDVRIELRGHAEYQLRQEGSMLTVTFSTSQ